MELIHIIKNGEYVKMVMARMHGDVPELKVGDDYYSPLGNSAIIARLGLGKLTPQMIIQRPEIWVRMGKNEGDIEALTNDEYAKRLKAKNEDKEIQLCKVCPGIDKLRASIADEDRYLNQLNNMMDDENNDGARPPKPIKIHSDELMKQYPAAASYIKAENWSHASHYAKSAAGEKAMKSIEKGEDHIRVIKDMEAEWSAHCSEHIWD